MAVQYNPGIVTDGLVLYLDAANRKSYPGTGLTCANLLPFADGSLLNGVTYSSNNGGTFVFDGTDDYINVPNLFDFSTTNEITASVWAKSNTENWDDTGMLVSKRDQFIIHPEVSSKIVTYYVRVSTPGWASISVTPSNITIYNNYAFTYNKGDFRIFLNGNQVGNNTVLATLNSDTGATTIGNDDGISRYLNGEISLVQIYNKVLSPEQVKQNFNALRGRFGI
jgi:hypothetical protein